MCDIMSDNNKKYITNYCNSDRIKCVINDKDILLFPKLSQKSFVLKSMHNTEIEKEFIKYVKNILIHEGATIIDDENFENKSYIKYLDVKMLIIVSFIEGYDNLALYTSSDSNGISNSVTNRLISRLVTSEVIKKYKIANLWNKLIRIEYWTYLFGNPNPTLILEIPNSILSENSLKNFEDILVNSIIEEFGDKEHSEEEKKLILKLKNRQVEPNDTSQSTVESGIKKETIINKNTHSTSNNKKNDDNLNNIKKTELKPKEEKHKFKTKKSYLPRIPINNIDPLNLNNNTKYPIIYPGDGPVHEFQRPKLDKKKS